MNLARLREAQAHRAYGPRSIGFIFQTFNLIPTLSAAENVEAALVPLGVGHARSAGRGPRAALTAVGPRRPAASPAASSCPVASSSGWRSPVRWSRSPKVLLADEPTGNLDEGTRDEIIALLEDAVARAAA